jgi:mannose-6-phosphate isomerase-like protein (cupin superfamily)
VPPEQQRYAMFDGGKSRECSDCVAMVLRHVGVSFLSAMAGTERAGRGNLYNIQLQGRIIMLIDFSKLQEFVINNFYGGEKDTVARMFTDELSNCIMYGKLEAGASIGFHKHDNGSEIVYVLQGKGKALYDGSQEELSTGVCHYCPKHHSHSLINDSDEDLLFFAVVVQQ